ncbi:hypothetical protein PR048_008222 [Dryococelus australis]|uniref:Retrovirus-related Pol polyprotein from transposon TNT 1-94-like beta-barrel domain-containing protein n=1 Tax=Dryococelus australis TaxID=614101 RepID=A0ABQ9HXE5_9NEOP|nr:hypothetical protein PR048_008222 [Dryococelus australis]
MVCSAVKSTQNYQVRQIGQHGNSSRLYYSGSLTYSVLSIAFCKGRDSEYNLTLIEDRVLQQIISCKTACDIWNKLHTIYEQKINYKKNETMSEYLGRVDAIFTNLKSLCADFNKSMAITKIISISAFHIGLGVHASRVEEDGRAESRLLIEEQQFKARVEEEGSTSSAAFQMVQAGRNCFICGKIYVMPAIISECAIDEWVMDSGASEHMSHDKHIFINYKELECSKEIILGDGKVIQAVGIGDLKLQANNEHAWLDTTLYNVLYVPNIKVNIFSVNTATGKGYQIQMNSESCRFLKQGSSLIYATTYRRDKLY